MTVLVLLLDDPYLTLAFYDPLNEFGFGDCDGFLHCILYHPGAFPTILDYVHECTKAIYTNSKLTITEALPRTQRKEMRKGTVGKLRHDSRYAVRLVRNGLN